MSMLSVPRFVLAIVTVTAGLNAGCDDEGASTSPVQDMMVSDGAIRPDATLGVDAATNDAEQDAAQAPIDGGPDAQPPVDGAVPMADQGIDLDAAVQADMGEEPDEDGSVGPADGALPDPDAAIIVERNFHDSYPIVADFTEGGIYDPTGHAFFVSSLASGGVYRIDANTGAESTLFEPDEPGVWWTLGMDLDVPANMLYVCAMDDRRELDEDHDYAGYLWGFDLDTGERVLSRALGDAAIGGTCTDVAVAADGTVYVNDRENPRLYAMPPGEQLELVLIDDALSGGIVGQNALLVLPDQSALLSLVYLPSRLVRISLPELVVSEVEIEGDFFDGLPALSGADGMAMSGGSLLVMFTSQLNRIRPLTGDWVDAISSTVDVESGMTDVVHTPEGDYLLNGQAVQFGFGRDHDPSLLLRYEGDL